MGMAKTYTSLLLGRTLLSLLSYESAIKTIVRLLRGFRTFNGRGGNDTRTGGSGRRET